MSRNCDKDDGPVTDMTEKMQKSLLLDSDETETYHRYVKEGKAAARHGDMSKSLELFRLAHDIHPSEKLQSRIKMIEEAIEEMARQTSEGEDDEFVNVNDSGLMLFKELYDKLYEHQKEGIAFLYGLHRDGKNGGILADDMGLGKTIQIIGFLSGMYDSELVKCTLLIMPTSLIGNWTKEFAKWTPGMRVKEFHGTNKTERNRNLEKIQRRGGVLITTYQMLITNWELLASYNGKEFTWDYVILDEAHKIKTSSTKTAKSAHSIPAKHRILLTGTPVQNNLREMWALFDFACQGALLGTSKTFKAEYENPITRAREKDATPGERALGLKISENLMSIIKPYFLRRTKQDVQKKPPNPANTVDDALVLEEKENKNPNAAGTVMPALTRKNDLIVWTYLSAVQEDIYNQFLSLDRVKELLMTTRTPLVELNILKKLCDHPRLLSARAVAQLGLEEGACPSSGTQDDNESAACRIDNISDETLISESGKLTFLVSLLVRLREENCRTLVFSQSRKMLDIIERVLINKGFKLVRIDGTIIHLHERERRIALFQTNSSYTVFLLTTQVGGVGITLTAANRVVIFDPSWNPATDAQAVDRAYRIGQKENVVIYRLITCGTVEEKIYRRQVFKDSLIRQTTGDKKNPFRYFSRQELKELFNLEDTRTSTTQLQLQSMHSKQRRTDPKLDEHIACLHSMEMFGVSDHDLMFSHDAAAHEDHPDNEESHLYIENRVQKAQELVKAESEMHKKFTDIIASNTEPAYLRQPGSQSKNSGRNPVDLTPTFHVRGGSDSDDRVSVVDLTQSDSESGQNVIPELMPVKMEPTTAVMLNGDSGSYPSVIDLTRTEHEQNISAERIPVKAELTSFSMQSPFDTEEHVQDVSMKLNELVLGNTFPQNPHKYVELQKSETLKIDRSLVVASQAKANISGNSSDEAESMTNVALTKNVLLMDDNASEESASVSCDLLSSTNSKKYIVSPEDKNLSFHNGTPLGEVEPDPNFLKLRDSILQNSDFSHDSVADPVIKNDSHLESFQGNFNLQLEDTNGSFSAENQESSLQEASPHIQLHMDSSSMEKDPMQISGDEFGSAPQVKDTSDCSISNDKSVAELSFIHSVRQKKKSRAICYSDDDNEGSLLEGSSPMESFKGVGSSTPRHERSVLVCSTPHRKSVGGNTSVASRRSLIETVVDDVEDLDEDMEEAEDEPSEYHSSAADVDGSGSEFVMEEEEPSGETLNTESEEEDVQGRSRESDSEWNGSYLEESTGDLELASDEKMDECRLSQSKIAPSIVSNMSCSHGDEYEKLVERGKESHSEGKLKEALDFFVKALDIRSGDPEIQLLTIQLYRQLSKH
ncbi:DNA excision repair protein ERCC-6-like [Brienomyrus brachyistius]|uniref:DNA excision repair protein ERCC-6-like n=1 Tax=Brienomyrus brachyistius TaxID=42636 RepID=UPI0020B3573B|nr:DNA excision repair protein ERCC-6-like [Brienomyrus brachyistius]